MSSVLTERQRELLTTLCANVAKISLGEKAIAGTLSFEEIGALCELISDEMLMNGIEETFEPNEYGKELESLLDAVNRPRLHE